MACDCELLLHADNPVTASSAAEQEATAVLMLHPHFGVQFFMLSMKSCLETLPVPFGSNLAQTLSVPCCLNPADGFIDENVRSN